MKNQTKTMALGIVLSGAFLTGCSMDMERLERLEAQVAEVNELARMAIACCDANSHRLNEKMFDMQKK